MDEDELEKLKEERKEQLDSGDAAEQMQDQEEQMRQQLKQLASQILTDEAQSRLGNIRVANPDLASAVEMQLVQLHRAGQIQDKITDEQLKQILQKLQESKDDPDIKYSAPR